MKEEQEYKRLAPGSYVALVAPAGPFEPEKFESGAQILREAGYRVVQGRSIFNKEKYLAGKDHDRLDDLTRALTDPQIDAVICIRGGYGSGRLLPGIPFSSLSGSPKLFIGHSDITFLHLGLISRAGWITFHGPNLTGMAEEPRRAECVLNVLSGRASFDWPPAPEQILRHGAAEGPVIGGNLSCLTRLVGTPYMPDMSGALLFIEDCSEALYRLDRMIAHLKLAGILAGLGAIIMGEFSGCAENSEICDMVMEHVYEYGFPVVHGLPFGHGARNDVIPLGATFVLDTYDRVFRILKAPISR